MLGALRATLLASTSSQPGIISDWSEVSGYDLSTTNWARFKNNPAASFTFGPGNAVALNSTADANGQVFTVARKLWTHGDFRLQCNMRITASPGTAGSRLFLFYFDLVGDGTPEFSADVSAWPSDGFDAAWDVTAAGIADRARGNTVALGQVVASGTPAANVSTNWFNGTTTLNNVSGWTPDEAWANSVNVDYLLTVTRRGSTLTVEQQNLATGAIKTTSLTSSRVNTWSTGRFGLRTFGNNDITISNMRISRYVGTGGLPANWVVTDDGPVSLGSDTSTNIQVLANDVAPASDLANVQLRASSTSAWGASAATARGTYTVQPDMTVGFQRAAGASGDDVVDYRPSPNASSFGRIRISMGGGGGGGDPPLPTPLRTINVSSGDQLRAALSGSLEPGTHIFCARGVTYSGTYTLGRAGTQANPIYIREAGSGTGRATFTGSIDLTGAWTGVHRLRLSGNPTLDGKVFVRAANCRITRCSFENVSVGTKGVVWFNGGTVAGMRVDRNSFVGCAGAIWRGNLTSPSGQGNLTFERNLVDDHSRDGDNEAFITLLLDGFRDYNHIIQYNLFNNCVQGTTNQKEGMSIKAAGTIVRGNTITNSGSAYISLRTTRNTIVEENWLENGAYIAVLGDDNIIRRNRLLNGALIRVEMGNCLYTDATVSACAAFSQNGKGPVVRKANGDCAGGHPAARRSIVEDNVSDVRVGNKVNGSDPDRTITARDTIVRRTNGTVTPVSGNHTNTTVVGGSPTGTAAVKLTAADVGPDTTR